MRNGPYIMIKAPDNYPGKKYRGKYAYEHHVIYWKKFGKIMGLDEVIHHKNHNKTDNKISNLELTTRGEHNSRHVRPTRFVEVECYSCKAVFKLKRRQFDSKKKRQNRFFCCRSHQVKTQHKERQCGVPELVKGPYC